MKVHLWTLLEDYLEKDETELYTGIQRRKAVKLITEQGYKITDYAPDLVGH